MAEIKENLEIIKRKIADAASRAGRQPGETTLVAVTKTVPSGLINQAIDCGVNAIGENRVQEAAQKFPEISVPVQWHLIGHLQSNKAKKAVEMFSLIHSIDSVSLAREVGRRALEADKVQEILLEVNTSGEPQKFGFGPEEVLNAIEVIKDIKAVKVLGLMTVGPLTEDGLRIRKAFRKLRAIFEQAAKLGFRNVEMKYLSMGMSGDFETAIEEGSNMVRIGSAIFGARG
ncbi:YggS family pyridoxal phosphate-dependent enzyme [candidate division TA06 bacterium]|uniref:Pyridoxal phosphate homeostasis protein n=1 Tax=candidate division TA06 bacterium TaxID=2250710 RepID=A0A933ICE9_UNCT6|nr:YggS family pyridoxal phosphate-dependent enzyme [candidate division TA06 bacterium]